MTIPSERITAASQTSGIDTIPDLVKQLCLLKEGSACAAVPGTYADTAGFQVKYRGLFDHYSQSKDAKSLNVRSLFADGDTKAYSANLTAVLTAVGYNETMAKISAIENDKSIDDSKKDGLIDACLAAKPKLHTAIYNLLYRLKNLTEKYNSDNKPLEINDAEVGAYGDKYLKDNPVANETKDQNDARFDAYNAETLAAINGLLILVNDGAYPPEPVTLAATEGTLTIPAAAADAPGAGVRLAPNAARALTADMQVWLMNGATPTRITGATVDPTNGVTIPYASTPAGQHSIQVRMADGTTVVANATFTTVAAPAPVAVPAVDGGGIPVSAIQDGGMSPAVHPDAGGIPVSSIGNGGQGGAPQDGGGNGGASAMDWGLRILGGISVVGALGYGLYRSVRSISNAISSRRAAAPAPNPNPTGGNQQQQQVEKKDTLDHALDGLPERPGNSGAPVDLAFMPSDKAGSATIRPEVVRRQILAHYPELAALEQQHSQYGEYIDGLVEVTINRFNDPAQRSELFNSAELFPGGTGDIRVETPRDMWNMEAGTRGEVLNGGIAERFVRVSVAVSLREAIQTGTMRRMAGWNIANLYQRSELDPTRRNELLERVREIHAK